MLIDDLVLLGSFRVALPPASIAASAVPALFSSDWGTTFFVLPWLLIAMAVAGSWHAIRRSNPRSDPPGPTKDRHE